METTEYVKRYDRVYSSSQMRKYFNYILNKGGWQLRINLVKELVGDIKKQKMKILDLGCGVGTFALEYGKEGHFTVGIDFSEEMIMSANKLKKILNLGENVRFIKGDVSKRNFRENSFDLIIAADIIEHLPDEILFKCVSECYRILKKGGKFILHTTPTKYTHYLFTKKGLLLILPLFWLPKKIFKKYVLYIDKKIAPRIFGKIVRDEVHCNCQTLDSLRNVLIKNRFRIKKIHIATYGYKFKYKLINFIFKKHEILKNNIAIICIK